MSWKCFKCDHKSRFVCKSSGGKAWAWTPGGVWDLKTSFVAGLWNKFWTHVNNNWTLMHVLLSAFRIIAWNIGSLWRTSLNACFFLFIKLIYNWFWMYIRMLMYENLKWGKWSLENITIKPHGTHFPHLWPYRPYVWIISGYSPDFLSKKPGIYAGNWACDKYMYTYVLSPRTLKVLRTMYIALLLSCLFPKSFILPET